MPKTCKAEIRAAAVEAYRSGETAEVIAERCNVQEGTILYWNRRAGGSRGRDRKLAPDFPDALVRRTWEESGEKVTKSAEILGCGTERMKRNLDRLGIEWKVWKRRPPPETLTGTCRICDFPISDDWLCTASVDDPTVHFTCKQAQEGRGIMYEELGRVMEFTNRKDRRNGTNY